VRSAFLHQYKPDPGKRAESPKSFKADCAICFWE
jgi:hypothetical protein